MAISHPLRNVFPGGIRTRDFISQANALNQLTDVDQIFITHMMLSMQMIGINCETAIQIAHLVCKLSVYKQYKTLFPFFLCSTRLLGYGAYKRIDQQ